MTAAGAARQVCGDREVFQPDLTPRTVRSTKALGAVPKTAAPFANLQLNAFHDRISLGSNPGDATFSLLWAGVGGSRAGSPGSLRPVGGVPALFLLAES